MMARVLFKHANGPFNCLIPFYKPPGICSLKICDTVRSELIYLMYKAELPYAIKVDLLRYLEPSADGVLTVRLGDGVGNKRKIAAIDHVYRATVEFGVEHEYNIIDGDFLGRKAYDHVSADNISEALKLFTTVVSQPATYSIPVNESVSKRHPNEVVRFYNKIPKRFYKPEIKVNQRYKFVKPPIDVICDSIELVDYCKPFAELRISCQSLFSTRIFVGELAEKLDTKATLVKLTRIKEGPFWLDDLRVLKLHELNVHHYLPLISMYRSIYKYYEPPFITREQLNGVYKD